MISFVLFDVFGDDMWFVGSGFIIGFVGGFEEVC